MSKIKWWHYAIAALVAYYLYQKHKAAQLVNPAQARPAPSELPVTTIATAPVREAAMRESIETTNAPHESPFGFADVMSVPE